MLQFLSMQQTIALGAGCFWCSEAAYTRLKGVSDVRSGYAGGSTENPTYDQVCTGRTGHAEVVSVSFDDNIITLEQILSVFFTIHDPTTLNRQGHDVGTQYRSIILCTTDEQIKIAEEYISRLDQQGIWKDKIVTEVVRLDKFYEAEADHFRYYDVNRESSYCQIVINPKLEKLKAEHKDLLK